MRGWSLVVLAIGGCGRMGFDARTDADPGSDSTGADSTGADSLTPSVCGPGELVGTVTSDFATGLPAWSETYVNPPAVVDFPPGQMRVAPGVTAGEAYSGITGPAGDFRSHRVAVRVPTMINTATCAQASLTIADMTDDGSFVEISQACGQMEAIRWQNGTPNTIAGVTYQSTGHLWWQLREAGGMVHYETSPDGVTWNLMTMIPTPSYFDAAYVDLAAGTYQTETGQIGEVRYDDLIDCVTP